METRYHKKVYRHERKQPDMKLAIAIFAVLIGGCSTIQLPPGEEQSTTFIQRSDVEYKTAYRIISKQMRACYVAIGLFGNGYDLTSDLDTDARIGLIEYFSIGLSGTAKFEDSMFSRKVYVTEEGTGSSVKVVGNHPTVAYMNHLAIKGWLSGNTLCKPADQ